ncbi:MAG: enoyl-CoA hydratase-related protein [Dehalococcoidales bacterium]|nr:enoyl-CoA hydratase-related protein [Dehalococcoidales bacterium]
MGYKAIIYEPGTVTRVKLNRPNKLNAQNWTLLLEMDDAFNKAIKDPNCSVIILSGEGRAFSAGHDLDSPEQIEDRKKHATGLSGFNSTALTKDIYVDMHIRWRDLPKPMIAMVHGYCIFGGWMIAAAMDFIFASEDAMFIPTYGDYFTTPYDVGVRKAKEILFENTFMTAREAMKWGFVNRVYPAADLEKETLKYAARVVESGQFYNRTVKTAINQAQDMAGFSTFTRGVGDYFVRTDPTPRPPAPQSVDPTQGRFRGLAARSQKYLKEDYGKPSPML